MSVFRRFSSTMAVVRRVNNVTKSSLDKRQYRGVELSNGLKALLVSDPTTDKSAASMDVAVGHMMDPWDMQGTAHFCEHMLFMGTQKYPVENEYSKFVSSNAGMTNAFTSSDHTCYYFDVKPESFREALDRFVQFFLTPQFAHSAVDREVLAVDSEHSKNQKSDLWRLHQVDSFLSKSNHDLGKFGTGDKFTLGEGAIAKGLNPREELLKFYQKWYSSNIMTCVLVGKESLDELENYLVTLDFYKIPNRNVEKKYWNEHPYGPEQLKRKVMVVPIEEKRELKIMFNIPYLNHEYKSSPSNYLSHLLGHEGKGSLLSELKRQKLVTRLYSSEANIARGISTFYIDVLDGLKRIEDIVGLTFQYIALLKKTGVQRFIYDEIKNMANIDFEFKNKEKSDQLVRMASRLHECQLEDVLTFGKTFPEYRPDLIESILNCLNPDNFFYVVVDKSIAGREGNIFEPIYGTELGIENISTEQLARYHETFNTLNPVFHLPEKNEYIPTSLKLKDEKPKSDIPAIVMDNQWIRVWHKKDDEYNLPKSITTVHIHSPVIRSSPRNAALLQLLGLLYEDSLTEDIYNPLLAGLRNWFGIGISFFSIEVGGYSEKQPIFIKFLLEHLVKFIPDDKSFCVQLEELQRKYRNAEHKQPTTLSSDCIHRFLWDVKWTDEQKLAESLNFTVKDILKFRDEVLSAFHIEFFSYGNVTEQETIQLANTVKNILTSRGNCRPLDVNEHWLNREVELPRRKELLYQHWKNSHNVSCVETLYQLGVFNTELHALNKLLTHIMSEPAFDQLRTKETLGYVVWTGSRLSNGISGIRLLVQGTHQPDFVRSRIHAFLAFFRDFLNNMTEEDFDQEREAVICELLVKPKTLDEKNLRFVDQIYNKIYDFRNNENMASYLQTVAKKDLLNFFDKYFSKDSEERKLLTVFVHSNKADVTSSSEAIKDYEEVACPDALRSTLNFLPRPQPKMTIPIIPSVQSKM